MAAYSDESDRAAALLIASFLESGLSDGLKRSLVEDDSVTRLFQAYGPLATLSGKIDIAFAVGLLTTEIKADLHLIRKIRNHFAHHPDLTDFTEAPVRDW
jgi:DNA-binding MltR family transcriptional regulator